MPLRHVSPHSQAEESFFTDPTASAQPRKPALPAPSATTSLENEPVPHIIRTREAQPQPSAGNKGYEKREDHFETLNTEKTLHLRPRKISDAANIADNAGSAQCFPHADMQRTHSEDTNTTGILDPNAEDAPNQGRSTFSCSSVPENEVSEVPMQPQPRPRRKPNPSPRLAKMSNGSAEEMSVPLQDSGISMKQVEQSASQSTNSTTRECNIYILDLTDDEEQEHQVTSRHFAGPSETSQRQMAKHTSAFQNPTDLNISSTSKAPEGDIGDTLRSAEVLGADPQAETALREVVNRNRIEAPIDEQEGHARMPYSSHPESIQSVQHERRDSQFEHHDQAHPTRRNDVPGGGSAPVTSGPLLQISTTPRASTGSSSTKSRPFRITKPQRKMQPRGQAASGARADNLGPPKPTYADIFEQQLQSIRVSYYAESVRHESHFGAQVQIRDTRIADLEEQVRRAQDHVIEVERKDAERVNKAKQQRDAVKDLQKYVKGLSTDHAKFRESTKNHERSCSNILETRLSDFQKEKAELEQDFLRTVEKLERARRSTKELLQDCYTKLEVSESKRLGLLDNLRIQAALYADERKKRTDLEQQVTGSLATVQMDLQRTEGLLREKLTNLESSINDPAKDEKWAVPLNECVGALKSLQTSSLLTVKDAQKAEGMLRYILKK